MQHKFHTSVKRQWAIAWQAGPTSSSLKARIQCGSYVWVAAVAFAYQQTSSPRSCPRTTAHANSLSPTLTSACHLWCPPASCHCPAFHWEPPAQPLPHATAPAGRATPQPPPPPRQGDPRPQQMAKQPCQSHLDEPCSPPQRNSSGLCTRKRTERTQLAGTHPGHVNRVGPVWGRVPMKWSKWSEAETKKNKRMHSLERGSSRRRRRQSRCQGSANSRRRGKRRRGSPR